MQILIQILFKSDTEIKHLCSHQKNRLTLSKHNQLVTPTADQEVKLSNKAERHYFTFSIHLNGVESSAEFQELATLKSKCINILYRDPMDALKVNRKIKVRFD